ncbi:hypothetical protein [Mycobacterium phage SWU1]|uniref:Glycine-rich domain-containing protein n=1 Tax=Mycobacterium phage SWU1 TaxID=1175504 RepID=I1V1G2_9CAUD|nr:minor tail protein [Mycobacterium phage SWU1]AFI24940.1 hypothetical protein [Mycobacterium phage SWU1]
MTGISLGVNDIRNLSIFLGVSNKILKVSLGTEKVWPAFTPVLTTFATVGAYTYNIPDGAKFIDVILLGGGGGGKGMALFDGWGRGGDAGSWAIVTLERGVHIPLSTKTITGLVGAGGAFGDGSATAGKGGGPGGNTTAIATGWAGLTAAGGAGGTVVDPLSVAGKSPGDRTYNGQLYVGGAQQNSGSGNGNAPGGGGAGAQTSTQDGGSGARGQAWFFAY